MHDATSEEESELEAGLPVFHSYVAKICLFSLLFGDKNGQPGNPGENGNFNETEGQGKRFLGSDVCVWVGVCVTADV